jgi:hypothetical protein
MSKNLICSLGSTINDIPNRLVDQTTYMRLNCNRFHTIYTYLFCLILRCIIGILIYEGFINSTIINILCLSVIILFGNKYLTSKSWKNYLRIVMIYSIILIINNSPIDDDKKNNINGILIILDAMMGLQSRFIATNII